MKPRLRLANVESTQLCGAPASAAPSNVAQFYERLVVQHRRAAELCWFIAESPLGAISRTTIEATAEALRHAARAELFELLQQSPTDPASVLRLLLERSGSLKNFQRSLAAGARTLHPEDGRTLGATLLQSMHVFRAVDLRGAQTIERAVALFLSRAAVPLDLCLRAQGDVDATLCLMFVFFGAWAMPGTNAPMSEWRASAQEHARANAACELLRGLFTHSPAPPAPKLLH